MVLSQTERTDGPPPFAALLSPECGPSFFVGSYVYLPFFANEERPDSRLRRFPTRPNTPSSKAQPALPELARRLDVERLATFERSPRSVIAQRASVTTGDADIPTDRLRMQSLSQARNHMAECASRLPHVDRAWEEVRFPPANVDVTEVFTGERTPVRQERTLKTKTPKRGGQKKRGRLGRRLCGLGAKMR